MTNRVNYWKEYKRPPEYYVKAAEAQRNRRRANPEKYRAMGKASERRRKLKRYGLTEEEYKTLLLSQEGKCAICRSDNNNNRDWHVDHCHATNIVRGVLCHHCNLMLGNARDSIENLSSAIKYLERF